MPVLALPYLWVVCWLVRRGGRRLGPGSFVLWFAALWALFEWVRGHLPELPYPHGQVAHAFYDWPLVLLPVRLAGEIGMNALVAGLAAALWVGLRGGGRARRWRPVAAVALAWALASLPAGSIEAEGAPLRVVLVQNGLSMYPDRPGFRPQERRAADHLAYNRRIRARLPEADLVVWPESAASHYISEDRLAEGLRFVASELGRGTPFAFGGPLAPAGADRSRSFPYWNAAFLCDRDGRLLGRREKQRLVPVGERLPLLPLLLSRRRLDRVLAWLEERIPFLPRLLPGRDHPLPRLPDGRGVGLTICFENAYPEVFADLAREGASFFAVQSNEAWYEGGAELDQMVAMTVFRALETGRTVLRATTDGITCAVTGRGAVAARLPAGSGAARFLELRVQPVRGSTPAMRWAGALRWALLALLLVLPVTGKTRTRTAAAAVAG